MAKKMAYLGIFISLAVVISYLERFIPVPIGIPGIKLGLANVVVLITLYYMGTWEAFVISIVRVVVSGFMFASFSAILYSLAGALLSFAFMYGGKQSQLFGMVGVSVLGGVFHNIGQITVAALVVQNAKVMYYLSFLIIAGVISGVLTGVVAGYSLSHLKRIGINRRIVKEREV